MAVGNVFGNLMEKARSVYNNFFYDGSEAPSPRKRKENSEPQQEPAPVQQPQAAAWQYAQAPQYPGYQQPFQQPAQAPVYQQPVQQAVQQQPAQPAARNRRSLQHAAQQEMNNVVDFGAYQQHNSFFGKDQPQAAQQPVQEPQPPAGSLLSARVINARSMADCRSAITLLRNGDAVVIVLENVTEPSEMRRLVDTLSGACYSLTATITKVSRYGVYLLAPQTLAVFADQTTNMMNNAPVRQAPRPQYQQAYQPQRAPYGQQPQQQNPYANQQNPYAQQQNPYAGQAGFTQRSAQQEEAQQDFYQRPAPQAAAAVGFSAQPAAYGYAPDEAVAAEQ